MKSPISEILKEIYQKLFERPLIDQQYFFFEKNFLSKCLKYLPFSVAV